MEPVVEPVVKEDVPMVEAMKEDVPVMEPVTAPPAPPNVLDRSNRLGSQAHGCRTCEHRLGAVRCHRSGRENCSRRNRSKHDGTHRILLALHASARMHFTSWSRTPRQIPSVCPKKATPMHASSGEAGPAAIVPWTAENLQLQMS
jgi:hypothetical protein